MIPTSTDASRSASSELWVYTGIAIVIVAMTVIVRLSHPSLFRRFVGGVDPVAVVVGASVLGAALLLVLSRRGAFAIFRFEREGPSRALVLATLFGVAIVVADSMIVHPADMNVPFPRSLLFYPVVGFVAEIALHLVPLSILWPALSAIASDRWRNAVLWGSVAVVALIEPALQSLAVVLETPLVGEAQPYSPSALAYDGLHIFAINLTELYIFRRYDFVSMLVFRLAYYLIWHIAWGHVRLGALF